MKSLNEWIALVSYLFLWFFSFRLLDIYLKRYNLSEKDKVKLYSVGLILSCLVYNSEKTNY